MSFSILFALLTVPILVIVFFVMYKMKGLKSALIVTGLAFALLAVALVATIGLIVNTM